ncbi:putative glutamate--cysteine ligase 2-3 [Pilimelia terevasa]|uniref:Putative glutamate--cysteine ligase 2 n=1 Tax=Pilimelia terevasa TaxID=53372 RepID=A0A8J3BHJ3_9ACTN|nr:putative glutamate--cysteine ligase 2-3 [Pilimelia terevasa]
MHIDSGSAAVADRAAAADVLTLGVEEEFLLLDLGTGENLPVADAVVAALPARLRAQSRLEFRRSMVELVSLVCTDLSDLHGQLGGLRRAAAAVAAEAGARLVAVGATPVAEPDRSVPDQPRYRAIARRYGAVASDPAVCGCHVHVGVPDRDLAVRVCHHLRDWLPVVQALTANSPLYAGRDTGYASWRSVQLDRWPSAGPTPVFASAADYDDTVAAMITSGVILDPSMVYWYARPSPRYPTVEVRVGDVCPTAADTVVVAALVRALVATVLGDIRAGRAAPRTRDCLVAAAHWHAAHEGMAGTLVDLRHGVPRPAWDLVDELLLTVAPALDRHGDLDRTVSGLARLCREGTGAARQRHVHRGTGDLHAVLADLAGQTVSDARPRAAVDDTAAPTPDRMVRECDRPRA